ncbi:MAG: hypothetical protein KatS3mg115_2154 [Candidatus Poribacteria bacterium]|nr:MAG: hypothetical protein KatS3mg115_2154 [Candidatus Poribacteria bacterium]
MPVRVLPEEVANQIAAGEVVERPASVVKELVENALDAGATEIRVELLDGGRRFIQVSDNGSGMSPEDALLAIRRHATSKLQSAEDLLHIQTLGFRGEALPSIASVSKFELITRTADALEGTRILIEGGKLIAHGPIGCPVGTQVTVRSLFYNVPARLKFLKAVSTELTHVVQQVQWAALTHPSVRFILDHQRRTLLDVPGTSDRLERIRFLYGKEFASHLIPFVRAFETLQIEGYVGDPDLTKPNRSFQFYFVNGRPVRDRTLAGAVSQALENLVPKGRHPVVFLFLTLPPEEVDVNVHPAKAEVRFRSERAIFRAVVQAIGQGIGSAAYIPEVRSAPEEAEPPPEPSMPKQQDYPTMDSVPVVPPARVRYSPQERPSKARAQSHPRPIQTERPSIGRRGPFVGDSERLRVRPSVGEEPVPPFGAQLRSASDRRDDLCHLHPRRRRLRPVLYRSARSLGACALRAHLSTDERRRGGGPGAVDTVDSGAVGGSV